MDVSVVLGKGIEVRVSVISKLYSWYADWSFLVTLVVGKFLQLLRVMKTYISNSPFKTHFLINADLSLNWMDIFTLRDGK